MTLLLLSILGLALGPLLDGFASRKISIVIFLEGFVAATIMGLVLGHILPEAAEIGGWRCLPVAFVGLIGPQILEKWSHRSEHRIHGTVATLALAGLFFHTLLDGAALTGAHHPGAASPALGMGILLHRLPVGLTVWWLVRRSAGTIPAVVSLLAICAGTLIGYQAGEATIDHLDTISVALFQAFVGGSLVHVVLHRSLTETATADSDTHSSHLGPFDWSGIGAVIGIAVLLLVPLSGHAAESQTGVAATFMSYWSKSAPFLLLGYLLVSLLRKPANHQQSCTETIFRTTFTNWQSHPDISGISQKAALCILILSPVLYLPAILLAFALLGFATTAALVLTLVAVALLLKLTSEQGLDTPDHTPHFEMVREAGPILSLETAVDRTAPWVLIGLLAASLLHVFISPDWITGISGYLQIVVLAALGSVISLPMFAGLPIALAYLSKGGVPGAAVSLLITGAVVTSTSLHLLRTKFSLQIAILFATTVVSAALLTGFIVNHLQWATEITPVVDASFLHQAAAVLLGILYTLSLMRLGPGRIVAALGHTSHHHNH